MKTLLRCLYVNNYNWKQSSYLMIISLLQNQCCLQLESQSFTIATSCHISTKPLEDDKVPGHCHITGRHRGAAHNTCNLLYRTSRTGWKLPVVIHNLKGYDNHLIVKALKSEFGKVSVIPQNMGKYLSLTVGRLNFIDSFQFAP